MKPFPAGFGFSERPWWHDVNPFGPYKAWTRSKAGGGRLAFGQDFTPTGRTYNHGREEEHEPNGYNIHQNGKELRHDPRPHTTAVVAALQAELDAEFPLPHPGYRVGQIWLVPARGGLAQVLITGVDPSGRVYTDKGQAAWNSWDDSEDLLCDAFLLFDPISPASAPWSPT